MTSLRAVLADWIAREPTACLWLAIAAAVFFGVTFVNSRKESDRAWAWLRQLIEALIRTLVLVAVCGAVYFLLDSDYSAFSKVYGSFTTSGSLSNRAWQQWEDKYGNPFTQEDLQVTQYVTVTRVETLQSIDPTAPLLYRNVTEEETISPNSITGFRGQVNLNLAADQTHLPDSFLGYDLSALYEYDIVNPTDQETRVAFVFPLTYSTALYQNILIQADGQEVKDWSVTGGNITWSELLEPGEQKTISIQYKSRGMDGYALIVSQPREILGFNLTLTLSAGRDT